MFHTDHLLLLMQQIKGLGRQKTEMKCQVTRGQKLACIPNSGPDRIFIEEICKLRRITKSSPFQMSRPRILGGQ